MVFKPGQSGNPGGRPKEIKEMVTLARGYSGLAIGTLVEICTASDSPAARVSAATALLDRGWGRPMQPNEHSGIDGAPLMPTLSVTLTNQTLPAPAPVKTIDIDGNGDRG